MNGNNGAAPVSRPLSDIVIEFGKHTLAGIALFLIIAAAAVALDLLVRYLSALKVSVWLITGLQVIEISLFVADVILLVIFLVRGGARAARHL